MQHEAGLTLRVVPGRFAICRLPVGADLPAWVRSGVVRSVTWTDDETSIVCAESDVPDPVQADRGWRALRVVGALDFNLTGILFSLTQPLAAAQISIFALSTYDTDYLLVKEVALAAAVQVLLRAGHRVKDDGGAEVTDDGVTGVSATSRD